jgi:hypothetical protein
METGGAEQKKRRGIIVAGFPYGLYFHRGVFLQSFLMVPAPSRA